MKVLFLDDNLLRLKLAKQHFIGYELFLTETVEETIKLLETESPFDLVSLDHDLGGKTFVPSDKKSGYEVAKFIYLMPDKPKKVIVHSFNPVGAENMMRVLNSVVSVEHIPFNLSKSDS